MRLEVTMSTRKRRVFTEEFKADTVKLVRDGGRSISRVARDLDLTETSLREWVRLAEIERASRRSASTSRPHATSASASTTSPVV
jgi:transposase